MKKRELINLGFEESMSIDHALAAYRKRLSSGCDKASARAELKAISECPEEYREDAVWGDLARHLLELRSSASSETKYDLKTSPEYRTWGEDIEEEAHTQMRNACSLPISVAGALMPDAHTGYGLPIGGVLATDNAVIPYAVGVDIACRVMISVCDFPVKKLVGEQQKLERILEDNTRFGMGATFEQKRQHDVLDEDWTFSPVTGALKDKAWSQLGTSGSGNHFAEFGILSVEESYAELSPGSYVALVTHSGSRGAGSQVANHFSTLARKKHSGLPKHLSHLAWLSMDEEGQEYWEAMQLMGRYASANHHVIHNSVLKALGVKARFQVENHHNFAWRETHFGRDLIVHRKGATPAAKGVLGYIPGTMVDPGYLVEGLGNPDSLHSSSHGAGRLMSRRKARESSTQSELRKVLSDHGVHLLSAGLDEAPHAYKDIDTVMHAQQSLVRALARFVPKIVKMAPDKR